MEQAAPGDKRPDAQGLLRSAAGRAGAGGGRPAGHLGSDNQEKKKEGPRTVTEYLERWAEKYVERKLRGISDPAAREERREKVGDYSRSYKQVVEKLEKFMPGIRPDQLNDVTVEAFEEWVLNHEE